MKKCLQILLAAVVLLKCSNHALKVGSRRVLRFKYVKICEEPQNSLTCRSIEVRMGKKGETTVDADCYVSRRSEAWKKMDIMITKCNEVESGNTCEYFQTWSFKSGVCAAATAKNVLWSDLISNIEPTVRCPFEPGNYTCRGGHVNADAISHLPYPVDNIIFIAKVSLYSPDDTLHVCFILAFQVMRVRA